LEFGGELSGWDRLKLEIARRWLVFLLRAGHRGLDFYRCDTAGFILQLFDEGVGFVTGELSAGLALRETHWSAGITEVGVTGLVQEFQ
jgi:hypothetical protein